MAFGTAGWCLGSRAATVAFANQSGQVASLVGTSWRPLHYSSSSAPSSAAATTLPLSPAVRYLIDSNSLDPSLIPPSGPHSRLLKGDVLWYMEDGGEKEKKKNEKIPFQVPTSATLSPPPPPPRPKQATSSKNLNQVSRYTDIPISDVQRSNATSLVHTKMSVPQSSASIVCKLGRHVNVGNRREVILLESHIIKAAAVTLKQLPHSNALWNGDQLIVLTEVNVAARVTSDEGKLLPAPVIITNADRRSVESIVSSMVEEGRVGYEGRLGGVATEAPSAMMVSSLMPTSLSHYIDVVQPPHSATLSISGVQSRISETAGEEERGGERGHSSTVTVSLSSDSRVLNSHLSSQWLEQFQTNLELLSSL